MATEPGELEDWVANDNQATEPQVPAKTRVRPLFPAGDNIVAAEQDYAAYVYVPPPIHVPPGTLVLEQHKVWTPRPTAWIIAILAMVALKIWGDILLGH